MILFLPHALEAMEKRNIAQEWVIRTVRFPDWTEMDAQHPDRIRSCRAIPEIEGRVLRVVHWTDGPNIVILTAYPDRDATKRRSQP